MRTKHVKSNIKANIKSKSSLFAAAVATVPALIVSLFLIAGCATPSPDLPPPESSVEKEEAASSEKSVSMEEMPEWYLDPQSAYPQNRYVAAVGSGDKPDAAKASALGALSQRFQADVKMDTRSQKQYQELVSGDGDKTTEKKTTFTQGVNVKTNQSLLNVQFGEVVRTGDGQYHTIAYLERAPTGRLYLDMIGDNSSKVQYYLGEAEKSDSVIRRFAFLNAASTVARANEVLLAQLRIIAPSFEQQADIPYDINEINTRRTDVTTEMKVSVSIGNDVKNRISEVVKEALSEEQFVMGESGPLAVQGQVEMEEQGADADFKTVIWALSLNMVGPDGGSYVSYTNQGEASGVSMNAARSFAYEDMEAEVKENFAGALNEYLNEMVLGE